MDIVNLLPEYLDMGVDQEEIRQIAMAALAQRIREIKLSVAQAVVQAKVCTMMDDLEGSDKALQQARLHQREYHELYAQWRRLAGSYEAGEADGNTNGQDPESGTPEEMPGDRRGNQAEAVSLEVQR